jgi:hypothetical protein
MAAAFVTPPADETPPDSADTPDSTPGSADKPSTTRPTSEMSTQQIHILIDTANHFERALKAVPDELARRLKDQRDDVVEKRRRAQTDESLLRLRIR